MRQQRSVRFGPKLQIIYIQKAEQNHRLKQRKQNK